MRVIQPYKHDCDLCSWVGWTVSNGKYGNMYICRKEGLTEIVIRWSDEPSDYSAYAHFDSEKKKQPCPIQIME